MFWFLFGLTTGLVLYKRLSVYKTPDPLDGVAVLEEKYAEHAYLASYYLALIKSSKGKKQE